MKKGMMVTMGIIGVVVLIGGIYMLLVRGLKHPENLAVIVPCTIIVMFIARAKGSRRSRLFGWFMGVVGLVFLGGALYGMVTRQYQHIQAEAVLGILQMLFGCTCLMASHIHLE